MTKTHGKNSRVRQVKKRKLSKTGRICKPALANPTYRTDNAWKDRQSKILFIVPCNAMSAVLQAIRWDFSMLKSSTLGISSSPPRSYIDEPYHLALNGIYNFDNQYPSWRSWLKFKEIFELILLASGIPSRMSLEGNFKHCTLGPRNKIPICSSRAQNYPGGDFCIYTQQDWLLL